MTINWQQIQGDMLSKGLILMKEIKALGYEAYIVGGAVRDIVMGSTHIHDVDIATNMPMPEIKKHFRAYEYGGGERHGTLLVNRGGDIFELTQFRTESTYSDGRRPDTVSFVHSFEEDTKRRDFTINAMGVDADGIVIDFHGGVNDISLRVLRCVGEPVERFNEDALRMVRAVRIASKLGFKIDDSVIQAIKSCSYLLNNISNERIRDELQKMAEIGPQAFAKGIDLFEELGVLGYMIKGHRNSLVVDATSRIANLSNGYFELYLAILFDVYVPSIISLGMQLKLTNDQIMSIDFAYNSINKIDKLMELPRVDAYKLVSNKYFSIAIDLYLAYHDNESIRNDVDFINRFKKAYQMQKVISELMLKSGEYVPGPDFGKTLKTILSIVFHYYETNNSLPTEDSILNWLNVKG